MRQLINILLILLLAMPVMGQQKRTASKGKTTQVAKKSTTAKTKTQTKTTVKGKKQTKGKQTTTYTNSSIRGLQSQRSQIQKRIREQEQALRSNQANVKKRLQDLMVLNSAIADRQRNIENIQRDITYINGDINILQAQLNTLEQQLAERKQKYVTSLRYMARNRHVQDKLMFIFSAQNLSQMFRRMRFVRQYASFQRGQGELVMAQQQKVEEKRRQLEATQQEKRQLLNKGQQEQNALQGQQAEQQKMVASLRKQQKTIQGIIDDEKKKDAALNAQIDRLIAQEAAKARARAEAEAKRKAAAEAAARKRAAEELARKKAAAEAAARENARRIAEAKAREERAKEEARKANARERAKAEQAAREAEAQRMAAEKKATADAARSKKEIESATRDAEESQSFTATDRMLSGGFAANRGRLPMPITGSYKIVAHFGQQSLEGYKHGAIDNKGIKILGSPGCQARSIYDGEVTAVFGYVGSMVVMVRHGSYISVYCNLRSSNVTKGQHVSTRQVLGAVDSQNILQFQLHQMRNGSNIKLNPEQWLGR